MKNLKTLLFVSLALLILGSCSIERRIHNKGFHVEWNKRYKSSSGGDAKDVAVAEKSKKPYTPDFEAAEEKETVSNTRAIENESEITAVDVVDNQETAIIYDERSQNTIQNKAQVEKTTSRSAAENTIAYEKASKTKKKSNKAKNTGGSSQIIALILVIFLGLLGIHRFYLGYTGIGILMLLTAGVFGILALIDLIRIVMGTLKPKNGEYTEKL